MQDEIDLLLECNKDTACFHLTSGRGLCKVVEVYDADTCTVIFFIPGTLIPMKQKVRLYGIDAPEMKPSLKVPQRGEIIAAAIRAKKRVEELVLNQVMHYECKGNDKYGRLLSSLKTLDGVDVADCLLQEGHCKAYFGGKKDVT